MRTITLGHRSHRRWPRRGIQGLGDESASYVVPDDATSDVLIDSDAFWTGSEALEFAACLMFWVDHRIWHKDCTLASTFEGMLLGKKMEKSR